MASLLRTAGLAALISGMHSIAATPASSFVIRPAAADSVVRAELPRVSLSIAFPARKGKTINVGARESLQAALDRAQPGDEIVIQAGAVYVGPFTLPAKAAARGGAPAFIIVRSSGLASLAEGRRVTVSDAASMARITSPANSTEAIVAGPGASGWWLAGLEITTNPGVTQLGRLVRFGDGSAAQNAPAKVPSQLVLDRSYVHPGPRTDIRRCIDLQSAASAVINSWISECHSNNGDAQAILAYNGPGPYRIENNYLEASGENVMLGGADVSIPGQVPSDVEIRHNHITKPLTWKKDDRSYAGVQWSIKNLLEVKFGRRILIEGNVFENSWVQGQVGFALLLKTASDQKLPTSDITVRNNYIHGAAGGINMAGIDAPMARVTIENNLLADIGSPKWGDNGKLFGLSGVDDVRIAGNTGMAPSSLMTLEPPASRRLVIVDNVIGLGSFGIKTSGFGVGLASLNATAPGFTMSGNVLIGAAAPGSLPPGNCVAGSVRELGIGPAGMDDMELPAFTHFVKCATGGKMPGVDHDALRKAIASVKD